MRIFYALFLSSLLLSCSHIKVSCNTPPVKDDVVYVIEQEWHAEIGIPVEELDDNLSFFRQIFPDAHVILFGYGKKTFFTAPPNTFSEYVIGPFPGTAAIQIVGINVTPPEAYGSDSTFTLALPPGGARSLSEYIWNDLKKDAGENPEIVAPSTNPEGLFYAAESEYNLLHTCNTWTADALTAAGLPVSGDGVVFSYQVRNRAAALAEKQCESLR